MATKQSSEVTVTTDGPPAPSGVSATVQSNDQINVSWTGNGLDSGQYHVQMLRDGNSWVNPSGGPTTVSKTTTNASYGPISDNSYDSTVGIDSSFKFRVRSEANGASSAWAYSSTVTTDPIPPRNARASRPDANTITVEWTNASEILSKTAVFYRKDTGGGYGSWEWTGEVNNSTTREGQTASLTFDTSSYGWLEPNARYQFKVRHESTLGTNGFRPSEFVYADYGNANNVYFSDDFSSGNIGSWDAENAGGNIASSSGHADTGVGGPVTGGHYFQGFGKNSDNSTWLQKNLGDLSGETNVHVRCRFAVGSLDNSGENFGIDWYDGSSWQQLEYKYWEYNEQGWFEIHEQVPDSWLASDNRIRVGTTTSSGMFSGDYFAVDEVVVSDILDEYTRPAGATNVSASGSGRHEIDVSWTDNLVDLPETFYEIRTRVSGSGDTFEKIGEPSTTSAETVKPNEGFQAFVPRRDGEQYDIRVDALVQQYRRGDVESYPRSQSSTTTATTLLPAPSLSASVTTGETEIDLSGALNDDNSNGTFTFRNQTDSRDVVSRTVGSSLTVTDTGVDDGTTYDYVLERSTDHATATSTAVTQRAPKTLTRAVSDTSSTTISTTRSVATARSSSQTAETAVSFARGSVTAPRTLSATSDTSTNATRAVSTARSGADTATTTVAFERAVTAPRTLSAASETTSAVPQRVVSTARTATDNSETTADVTVALHEVFDVPLGEHEIRYDPDRVRFHTEWFAEPPLRRGANTLALRLGPRLDGAGVRCKLEVDQDGDGTVDVASSWQTVADERVPVTFDVDLADAAQVRILFADVRLGDVITRVETSYTTR